MKTSENSLKRLKTVETVRNRWKGLKTGGKKRGENGWKVGEKQLEAV